MPQIGATVVLRGTKKSIEFQIKKLVLDLTANLFEANPVDTGWSRSNWIPSIGESVDAPAGTKQTVGTAVAAQEAGKAKVASSYTLEQGSIFISNNVPYITLLNMGTSTQAPRNFVQQAIRKAIDKLR